MYPNMFNRDEIFFRLGVEKSKIRAEWDNNFAKVEKAKKEFLDLDIVKKILS